MKLDRLERCINATLDSLEDAKSGVEASIAGTKAIWRLMESAGIEFEVKNSFDSERKAHAANSSLLDAIQSTEKLLVKIESLARKAKESQ